MPMFADCAEWHIVIRFKNLSIQRAAKIKSSYRAKLTPRFTSC